MKKLFLCCLLLILGVFLCGCSFETAGSGESHRYLIASMGFDRDGDSLTATVEAVAVNSEDNEGKKRILINGSGEKAESAMNAAEKKATQPFNLSHCGVIVLGKNLSAEDFADICDYCYDTDEITFSVYMVCAENAAELLKPEAISSVAAGYDIMSVMRKVGENSGVKFQNSLYRVTAMDYSGRESIKLPFFTLSDGYRITDRFAVFENGSIAKFESF